jgi:hypothetical protein
MKLGYENCHVFQKFINIYIILFFWQNLFDTYLTHTSNKISHSNFDIKKSLIFYKT